MERSITERRRTARSKSRRSLEPQAGSGTCLKTWAPALLSLSLCWAFPEARALQNGTIDEDGRFGAVVAIHTPGGAACTATRIGPRQLLTAAHCVTDMTSGGVRPDLQQHSELLLTRGAADSQPPEARTLIIEGVEVAPDFRLGMERLQAYKRGRIKEIEARFPDSSLSRAANRIRARTEFASRFPDVAVLRVAGELGGIPTAPIDTRPLARGDEVVLVGYGCSRTRRERLHPTRRPRRWAPATVLRVDDVNLYSTATKARADAPSLCPGDSGGPTLRDGKVVGVNAVVYDLSPALGARSNMSARLDRLRHWAVLQDLSAE
jgi:hypothetical protein